MGKGDIKSKRGKIAAGSFGKKRPHKTIAAKPTPAENSKVPKE